MKPWRATSPPFSNGSRSKMEGNWGGELLLALMMRITLDSNYSFVKAFSNRSCRRTRKTAEELGVRGTKYPTRSQLVFKFTPLADRYATLGTATSYLPE